MEGRVIHEMFEAPPVVQTEAAKTAERLAQAEEAYSAEELEQVTQRLSDLGYLE